MLFHESKHKDKVSSLDIIIIQRLQIEDSSSFVTLATGKGYRYFNCEKCEKMTKTYKYIFFSFFPTSFISPIPKKWGDWRTWGATRERGQLLVLIFFLMYANAFITFSISHPRTCQGFIYIWRICHLKIPWV